MRLGALLLTAALAAPPLAAQAPRVLPWEQALPLPWQPAPRRQAEADPPPPAPSSGPLSLQVAADGTVRVVDGRGLVRLLAGLPGRPLRVWRDGGIPLRPPVGTWSFPAETPLRQGLGALRWCAEDFRPFLKGLCWVMEDGEGYLAVIHPATGRIIYLPLPSGEDLTLRFLPERLEVVSRGADPGGSVRWSIPWIGLLPRLAALGPQPGPTHRGTALVPFPQDPPG